MKKALFIYVIILSFLLSSCSITRKSTTFAVNSPSSRNNSPRFLKGALNASGNKVVSGSASYGYVDKQPSSDIANAKTDAASVSNFASLKSKYATIIGVSPEDMDNVSLLEIIDDWWGTPYVFGGNTKDGIDCSGFSQMLENEIFGENLPRNSQQQYECCKHIHKDDLVQGDLVFFHTTSGNYITHVGIYLQNNKFVHASSNGVMISDLNDDYWKKTYRAAGRLRDGND